MFSTVTPHSCSTARGWSRMVSHSGFFVARALAAFSSNWSVSVNERRSHMPTRPSTPPMAKAIRQP